MKKVTKEENEPQVLVNFPPTRFLTHTEFREFIRKRWEAFRVPLMALKEATDKTNIKQYGMFYPADAIHWICDIERIDNLMQDFCDGKEDGRGAPYAFSDYERCRNLIVKERAKETVS